ncbi:hypothetical protein HHK36_012569 [Tetracentron sinense]|uniref:Uncharacterized protein n=1 Tax=Tetracentron sinense TaxID=13715 RepID=A0A835DFL7_TETSI|nr:hypothetical protein HHK36_012569 [Tetracentron sinense]
MVDMCLMASSTCPPGLFHQEQGFCRGYKEFRPSIPSHGSRQEIIRSGYRHLSPPQLEGPSKPMTRFSEFNQFIKLDSAIRRPAFFDIQDTRPSSVLLSFGIAEQCTRHEKILQFLMSGSSELEKNVLDFSTLSDLMWPQTLAIDMCPQLPSPSDDGFSVYEVEGDATQPSLIYPRREFYDFIGDLACSSKIAVHPDGRFMFTSTRVEMKDLLLIFAEFYLSKNSTKWRKQSVLVPPFTRLEESEARANTYGSSLKLETATVAPLKSPEKIKLKPSPRKKHNRKAGRERDLYRKNYFHACESLLSLVLDKKRGKMTILSLKKCGPELPQLLTQFSAGIAGTGLAVLFSVFYKVACGRVPFCASRLLNTGFGFGLFWLSWAVNRLRDTIVHICKNSSKLGLKDEEMLRKVDRDVNGIYFRAATVMAVAVLRLA